MAEQKQMAELYPKTDLMPHRASDWLKLWSPAVGWIPKQKQWGWYAGGGPGKPNVSLQEAMTSAVGFAKPEENTITLLVGDHEVFKPLMEVMGKRTLYFIHKPVEETILMTATGIQWFKALVVRPPTSQELNVFPLDTFAERFWVAQRVPKTPIAVHTGIMHAALRWAEHGNFKIHLGRTRPEVQIGPGCRIMRMAP